MGTYQKAAQYCGDDLLHAAFSFEEFLGGKWKAAAFLKAIKAQENILENRCWPNYVLNNHDVIRSASRYAKEQDDSRLKVAAAMLLTLRGTPFLYYGEEIGMREGKFKRSEIQDPVGLHYYPFYKGRDGCRTPMQWDDSPNAGFSSAQPWLAINPDHQIRNVRKQAEDKNALLNFYKELLRLRKEHSALMRGDFEAATNMPANTLIYFRCVLEEQIMVALNFDAKAKRLDLVNIGGQGCDLLLSTHEKPVKNSKCNDYLLRGNEAAIFSLKMF